MSGASGTIYGLGLGPGDPELMTVRADRLLRQARHVAFFRKAGRQGRARRIADGIIPEGIFEYPMDYPVTTEILFNDPEYNRQLAPFYSDCCERLCAIAQKGENVVVLCEGDPFFYGSFMHLFTRISGRVPVEVVPAITGMSAAWTATGAPITWGDDVLTVLMGTLPEVDLAARMARTDALVVMKIGRNLEKVRRALRTAGLLERAWLVEYAAMPGQTVRLLSDVEEEIAPYFSIALVHGEGRRP